MADELTITVRVHDPLEKKDPSMSACWATAKIPRDNIGKAAPLAAILMALLKQLKNLKLT